MCASGTCVELQAVTLDDSRQQLRSVWSRRTVKRKEIRETIIFVYAFRGKKEKTKNRALVISTTVFLHVAVSRHRRDIVFEGEEAQRAADRVFAREEGESVRWRSGGNSSGGS